MNFFDIANSMTTDPGMMNDDFLAVAQGTILPKYGDKLRPTTSTYDIGSATYRFKTTYCTNIYEGDVEDTNGRNLLWQEITAISTSTTRIEITGLNGDADFAWDIIARMVGDPTSTLLYCYFNGDSTTANYLYSQIIDSGTAFQSANDVGAPVICLNHGVTTSGDVVSIGNTKISSHTGCLRTIFVSMINSAQGRSMGYIQQLACVWNNTASTITSIVLQCNTTSAIDFHMWRRG
jgi:hypothetical protein